MSEETVWLKLCKTSQDVINSLSLIYGNVLDMEIRQELAPWLENALS